MSGHSTGTAGSCPEEPSGGEQGRASLLFIRSVARPLGRTVLLKANLGWSLATQVGIHFPEAFASTCTDQQ